MNTYIVRKNNTLKQFPDLEFIKQFNFKVSDYFEHFLLFEIDNNDEIILNRFIKINKIKNINPPITELYLYLLNNQLSIHQVIEFINLEERNKSKYFNNDDYIKNWNLKDKEMSNGYKMNRY